ncbi:hypothetical protein EJD97_023976 [Solanum chilense]|uniref:Uncharacterized protein n=1 Tax=Solanum chilense TaxID=4083 RepID=A0A6N2CHU2_SOLCI|nr:hypothetical protein EJD97_023976 [Solanum chilense]
MQKRPPTDLMTVRRACDGLRWQRSAAAEGRWGSLTKEQQNKMDKYGTTKSMTVRRDHDNPSRGPSTKPRFDRFPANRVFV